MISSEYSRDLTDPDQPVRDAAKERGGPIRLRVQPLILRKNGNYKTWKTVAWTLDCDSPAEAFAIRDAMNQFFAAMAKCGPKAVMAALTAATTAHVGAA